MRHKSYQIFQSLWKSTCCALLLTMAQNSRAEDGTIDIRPTGAATFTINRPGSYVLVSDVTLTVAVHCISITTSSVTLDLNGHTLDGANLGGNIAGITGSGIANTRIRNGKIHRFTGTGIGLTSSSQAKISDIISVNNHTYGIYVSGGLAIVENCIACGNGKTTLNSQSTGYPGIDVGASSLVKDCIASYNIAAAFNNRGTGIRTGASSTVINNTCQGNAGFGNGDGRGIDVLDGCTVIGNTAGNNLGSGTGDGIGLMAGFNCTIINNTFQDNDDSSTGNGEGIGIRSGVNCLIQGNVCSGNGPGQGIGDGSGRGIESGDRSVIVGNVCDQNGSVSSGGVQTGYGIYVNHHCTVRDNHCRQNAILGGASAFAYGIFVAGNNNFITGNSTGSNGTAGIRLEATGISGGGNRVEMNRMADEAPAVGLSDNAAVASPNSIPTAGDHRENIAF